MTNKHIVHPSQQGKILLLRGKHGVQLLYGKQPACSRFRPLLFLQTGRRVFQSLRIIQAEAVFFRPGLFLFFLPGNETVEQDAGLSGKRRVLQLLHRFRLGLHKLRMGF